MKTKLICFIAACAISAGTFAQNSTWYFGPGGELRFGAAPANGPPAIASNEGCSIINDATGAVRFYTDGITVWDGNHNPTPGLMGNPSATQAAIIIPTGAPCHWQECECYFVFTVSDVESDYANGFQVSRVCATGTAPNTTVTIAEASMDAFNLPAPVPVPHAFTCEKLTAISDGSGGYWVFAHGVGMHNGCACWPTAADCNFEDYFYKVHVQSTDCNLSDLTIESQRIGLPVQEDGHPYTMGGGCSMGFNGQGQMKFNQQGTRLAMTFPYINTVQIFNFNQTTGVLGPGIITLSNTNSCFSTGGNPDNLVFGLEFSPNGNLLYTASTWTNSQTLRQFDLTSGNPVTICGSQFIVDGPHNSPGTYHFGCLQLGPDQRIYAARRLQSSLDVIQSPNVIGAGCGFLAGGAPLNSGTCQLGLPTLLLENPCEGDSTGCDRCTCNNHMSLTTFQIDADGDAYVVLNVGPGSIDPVSKFRITLVNYHSDVDPECLKCDIANQELFGDITGVPPLYGTNPEFAPYNLGIPVHYSREVTWCFPVPVPHFSPGAITVRMKYPPVHDLKCCLNDVDFCFRVEIWSESCRACDWLICYDGAHHLKKTDSKPIEQNPTPPIKTEAPQGKINTTPNPTGNGFDLQVPAQDLPGEVWIYDSHGSRVKQQKVSNESSRVDTKTMTPGIYFIKYKSATKTYEEKIIINR